MQKAMTALRILAAQKTKWAADERDLTIKTFLGEFSRVLTEEAIEYMAEHHPERLGDVFVDWATNNRKRKPEQRTSVLIDSISKGISPAIFLMASHHGDKDLQVAEPEPPAENVVSLFNSR